MAIKTIQDGYSHITTGVTTWRSGVPSLFRVKIETTWSATQVGLGPVESGLGGHDDGVSGLTRGSRTHHSRYENGDEWPCQNVRPPVILGELRKILSMRNETERRMGLLLTCDLGCMLSFAVSQPHKTRLTGKLVVTFIV